MQPNNEIKHVNVETYADDMAKVIENDPGGLVKKIIHGEEEHEKERKNLSPGSRKNRLFIFLSLVLILVSLVIISFFATPKNINTIQITPQSTPIIFTDKSNFIEVAGLSKDQIVAGLLAEGNSADLGINNVGDEKVEGIYLTENKNIIGLSRFASLALNNFNLNGNSFVDDNFLMGFVSYLTSNSTPAISHDFFILLKMRSMSDIFGNLNSWENKMFYDLHGFFGININPDNNYLLTKNFEDGIVENKNARILYDQNHQIVLMYIFADDNSVIITDTVAAAHEINSRLISSKIK